MRVLSVDSKDKLYKSGVTGHGSKHHKSSNANKNAVDDLIHHKKHIFVLIYMEGCGPCNATRPEWAKMTQTLQKQYAKNNDVVIVDVNKDLLPLIKGIGNVDGFPTMKYITNNGKTVESYEDSSVNMKDRSADSFINWIESKILKGKIVSITEPHHVYKRINKSKGQGKGQSKTHRKHSQKHKKQHTRKHSKSRKVRQ
jgi:thiol-disulfide isomerase/thioredoxin